MDIVKDIESNNSVSAIHLSERLSGHALAIAQMAGLIHKGSWSIGDFVQLYDKNTRKISGPLGKTNLDTVWRLSFDSLNASCKAFIGVLAYVSPDNIPEGLFKLQDSDTLPEVLQFCDDEFEQVSPEYNFIK